MKHLVTMGELLIDFIPLEKGRKLKEVTGFTKYPGGAPANVAVAGVKSGISSYFIGQVGKDAFGDYLVDCLKDEGVSCDYLYQSSLAKTALAYVTLSDAGERDFIFYRDPSADQLLHADQVEESILKDCVFHFCSVSLCDYPIRDAHIKAIDSARLQGGFISLILTYDYHYGKTTMHIKMSSNLSYLKRISSKYRMMNCHLSQVYQMKHQR